MPERDEDLPAEMREAMEGQPPSPRPEVRGLRLRAGDEWFPIRAMDETGFDIDLSLAPRLPGLVEIHDGATLLRTGLVVATGTVGDAMRYDFKRATDARRAPPRDWVSDEPWDAATA
jgi:hypothetical protein